MSPHQRDISQNLKKNLEANGELATQIRPAHRFYKAEAYHQHYFDKQGSLTHCHQRVRRF
jgi:peptide methionine sulfoxide reductase MsrA